jgi:hypothetical protein
MPVVSVMLLLGGNVAFCSTGSQASGCTLRATFTGTPPEVLNGPPCRRIPLHA